MNIPFVDNGNEALALTDARWSSIEETTVRNDWMGNLCPSDRHFHFQMAWNRRFIFIRFRTMRTDDCVIGSNPVVDFKTLGLWDRDVCEIFIAPNPSDLLHYYEFEIAPTGEWVDLRISFDGEQRKTLSDYNSDCLRETVHSDGEDLMMLSIPWGSLGIEPFGTMKIMGNVFRCTGSDPDRGYLALWPTGSERPNFHVPSAFGCFNLVD